MALPQEQLYTTDDIYNLKDGKRAELIDGQIFYMAAPSRLHQSVSGDLFYLIKNHIKTKGGSCDVYAAPFAVFLNKDNKTYLEPDISVICDPDKLNEKGCNGAPDWVIEITSQSTSGRDYIVKLNAYYLAGVREYWIVNPSSKTIIVYCFIGDEFIPRNYTFKDKINVNIYDDLVIDFNELNI